jgi:transcription elongation factor
LKYNQIGIKIDTKKAIATDHEGYEMRIGDLVKEVGQGVSLVSIEPIV